MKAVHVVAAMLVIAAIALAVVGQAKAAFGLLGLSTALELGWSMIAGRARTRNFVAMMRRSRLPA